MHRWYYQLLFTELFNGSFTSCIPIFFQFCSGSYSPRSVFCSPIFRKIHIFPGCLLKIQRDLYSLIFWVNILSGYPCCHRQKKQCKQDPRLFQIPLTGKKKPYKYHFQSSCTSLNQLTRKPAVKVPSDGVFHFSHAFCYHRPESIHQYCCWHTRRYSLYCLGQKYLRQKAACCKMADSRHQKQEQNSPGRLPDSRKSPLQKAAADRSVNTDKAMIFANSKDNRCFTGIWSITTAALTPGRVMQKKQKT